MGHFLEKSSHLLALVLKRNQNNQNVGEQKVAERNESGPCKKM